MVVSRVTSSLEMRSLDLRMEVWILFAFALHGTVLMGTGAYAEYIVVSTKMLVHKPEHLSWEVAAGIPEVGA